MPARPPITAPSSYLFDPYWQQDLTSPVRRIGFCFALLFVFVRFSMIHEVILFLTSVQLYLVFALGTPCLLFMVGSGGIRRTLRYRTSYYWLAFLVWMVLAIPLSSWRAGSLMAVSSYFRVQFVMLFIIAGLVMSWKECRQMIYAVALGGLTNVLTAHLFQEQTEGRMKLLGGGSIANSNDFAAHLLLVLTFVLLVFLTAGRNWLIRLGALAVLIVGTYEIIITGSRGAMIAVFLAVIYTLVKAPQSLRILTALAVPIILLLSVALVPNVTLMRYATLVDKAASAEDTGAEGSRLARTYLLQTGSLFSLQHPLFGVGPGEFADYEAKMATAENRRGMWAPPHNSYIQISSEAGIPALIFVLAALASTYNLLSRTHKVAKTRGFEPIVITSFCVMLGMVTFCIAIFFLSLAYHFYLPALSGIAIALTAAAQAEFAKAAPPAAVRQP